MMEFIQEQMSELSVNRNLHICMYLLNDSNVIGM
jgi:hypothetical protein